MKLRDWRKIAARIAKMDREELRDRLRQGLSQRQDGLLSRLNFNFSKHALNLSHSKPGKFFFAPGSVDAVLALLRERVPGQAERIIQQAENIYEHHFDLLGYEDLDYGSVIDWHVDPVHSKRPPRKLFYEVGYLDFDQAGDSKIPWELSRHQHLVTLAKAYRLTGDSRFLDETLRQWRDWQVENPYPIGIHWASSLEVGFRSLSWIWIHHLLDGSPAFDAIRDEWLLGLARHGRHIERYLSTYFSPNTHLLGEGVGLFFLGVLFPQLAHAERWKSLGWEIVTRESSRQVREDGFHFEQSTYYHVYALDFFLHFAVLARNNNTPIPRSFEQALEKMLDALYLLGRCGSPPRFGDDDGGRVFDARRNRSEHLLDPLAAGAILFHRGDFKRIAGKLREETIWLLGEEGVREWDGLKESSPSMDSAALSSTGLYLLTAAEPPVQLVMDAGPQGVQSGGHGHADALSICLEGRTFMLIDPGTYQYVEDSGERGSFRGTAMHNTLQVDGVDQAESTGPFSWKRLTQTKTEQWIQGPGFDFLVASHDGYQRLSQPVVHRRWVWSMKNGLYLVRDVVEGEGRHRLDIFWHLGPDMQRVEQNVFQGRDASQGLAILPAQGHNWEESFGTASWSPVYGQKALANVVHFSTIANVPAEFSTMLVALQEVHPSERSFSRIGGHGSETSVSVYQYSGEAGEYSFFFARSGEPWRHDTVSCDAEFLCWRGKTGDADQLFIACNGSYTKIEGGPELRCSRPVRWCSLHLEDGRWIACSSDPEAVEAPLDSIPRRK